VSSWREGSSVCPPYTSKSSYSKSEQSWRLPRSSQSPWRSSAATTRSPTPTRRDSYSFQSPTPTRSSSNYRSPSPVRQNTKTHRQNSNYNQGSSSDRTQNQNHSHNKPTSPPPPHRPPLPSPWRLEAAAYPPPGLRAGRRREGGGEPGEERLKDGEEESWRREETGGGEDYRSLYQRERQEKEECEVQLAQMDEQRRLLENNLKRFLDLKKELSSFQREAEESDRVVNDFIKVVVPDFTAKSAELRGDLYRACLAQADPDLSPSPTSSPPLPRVDYSWDDAFTGQNPIGRYAYSTTSRIPSKLDELRLNLVFDVNSQQLPTKLQLEIRDRTGRVVFRKRQDLYYVKVQERLSTLDAEDDYMMTVTTICGPATATEQVPIHNKYYRAPEEREETESVMPPLETCRSPSSASMTSGFDERSIDSIFDTPLKSMEATYNEVTREVTATPLPDLEEIVEVSLQPASALLEEPTPTRSCSVDEMPVDEGEEAEYVQVVEKKTPFLLTKRPVVPEVMYRWQRGFRRSSNGQYKKVPILRVSLQYSDAPALLPSHLQVTTLDGEEIKVAPVSGKVATIEVAQENGAGVVLCVRPRDRNGAAITGDSAIPAFTVAVQDVEQCLEGEWHVEQPCLAFETLH